VRRILVGLVIGAFAMALAPVATAEASSTYSLSGRFALYWPLPASEPRNAPCDPGALCGSGSLADFGAATITIESDDFFETDGCLGVDRVETIHLVDGSGDLVLDSTGSVCFPGRSGDAPDDPSYGNPSMWTFTSTVDGAVGRWTLSGSVTTG
jgi:hypothetical protein